MRTLQGRMSPRFGSSLRRAIACAAISTLVPACIGRIVPRPTPVQERQVDSNLVGQLEREAQTLRAKGRTVEAIDRVVKAQTLVPPQSRKLAQLLEFEAGLLLSLDEDAAPPLDRALKIWGEVAGEQSLEAARVAVDLGHAQTVNGEWAEAEPLFQRALEIYERVYGRTSEPAARAILGLLRVHAALCRVERAEELARRLMTIAETVSEKRDPELYANALNALAIVDQLRGRHFAAIERIRAELEAERAPQYRYDALSLLADSAESAGDFPTAIAARAEKLQIVESRWPSRFYERWSSTLELHFAYAAAPDQRLQAHDAKYRIDAATAGELWPGDAFPLFPRCEREYSAGELQSRQVLTTDTYQHFASCGKDVAPSSDGSPVVMVVWMRSDRNGIVQAASAAGVGYPKAVLECAARAAIGSPWHFPRGRGIDWAYVTP
jgi:tetratricopeptide (TPR) repeat protein